MLPKSSARIRASDTASGEDEWIGQGMAHKVRWVPGRKPGFGLGLGAGAWFWKGVCERSSKVGAQ